MTIKIMQMTPEKYRQFVAVQYLNASNALFEGLKTQQGKTNFHFMTTVRSFIEYTRRGIWFPAWATDEQLRAVTKVTFQRPGSPSLEKMDALINEALGGRKGSNLMNPVKEINNEPYLHLLHALTHGNPISVRMVSFGVDKIFQTDKLLMRAETDLNVFRVLLYRVMLGEEIKSVWKTLGPIHNDPQTMKANAMISPRNWFRKRDWLIRFQIDALRGKMLTFNAILREADIDPKKVRMVRQLSRSAWELSN